MQFLQNPYERVAVDKVSGLLPANVIIANHVTASFQGRNNSFLLTRQ